MYAPFRTFLIAAALATPVAGLAFEPSAAVKVTPLLETTTTWEGKQIVYPEGTAQITGLAIELAPGAETGWHAHPVPSFGMVLEGTLAVTLKDGRVKTLRAGEAIAEVIDTMHNGRNIGDKPVKLLVFYAGAVGRPLTTKR